MERKRNLAIAAVFLTIIFGFTILSLLLPDREISIAERRRLAQTPKLSVNAVFFGDYAEELEKWLLDQFPLREQFRTLKSVLKFYVFRQADNNGVYLFEDSASKLEYPLNEKQILYGANKLNALNAEYLQNSRVFYSIIPDKNYFTAEPTGHPHMDYGTLVDTVTGAVTAMKYVDIFSCLSAADYYRTDAHWMQESIYPVAKTLANAMGCTNTLAAYDQYTAHTLSPFYGVYCGQSALPLKPDTLTYLTSQATESATVTGIEFEGARGVYSEEYFEGMDGYDVFLSGAQALIEIQCPSSKTDRELIIFRDSFASSLAPYFIGAYAKITLIDLRYISSSLLGDYVDFDGRDVLFLYSTSLLNNAMLLK